MLLGLGGALASGPGCAAQDGPSNDDDAAGTDGDMGETGGDEGGDGDRPPPGPPARGIQITNVYANQGIRVPISDGSEWVDASGRTAPLVKNRNTLFRVMVDVDDDWQPREVAARINFFYEDGAKELGDTVAMVEQDSLDGTLSTSINFYVPAHLIRPSMGFQVELFDLDDSRVDDPVSGPVVSPEDPNLLGVEAQDLAIDVVVVPVKHDLGDQCRDAPEPDDVDLQNMAAFLKNYNPVSEVNVRVGPTLSYDKGTTNSFDGLLNFIAQARADAMDDMDYEYWYGVIRVCDSGPEIPGVGPTGGQAIAIPTINFIDDPYLRISMGRWNESSSNSPDGEPHVTVGSMDIFVHEIGHSQGRYHAPCDAPGADNNYPYPEADIGTYGYSELTNAYYEPNQNVKDYMSYCDPVFVSDYTYRGVLPFIRHLSGQKGQDRRPAPQGQILVGLVDDHGDAYWHVAPGAVNEADRAEVDAQLEDLGHRYEQPVAVYPRPEGHGYAVVIQLPDAVRTVGDLTSVHVETQGVLLDAPPAEIQRQIDENRELARQSLAAP